jgi:hypothetical protein
VPRAYEDKGLKKAKIREKGLTKTKNGGKRGYKDKMKAIGP